jgi:hypothetical protein
MRLNVRCCCQPSKILGTLEVPIEHIATHGGRFEMLVYDRIADRVSIEALEVRQIRLCYISEECKRLARFPLPPETEYAVYSEDRPIEFWRRVPGFEESEWQS